LHEVGYNAWAVRISSIRSALVEALIFLVLSHVQSNTLQPTLYVLPSITSHTLHTARQSSLEEVLSQNLPLRIGYTRTQRSPSCCLLTNFPASPLAPLFRSLLGIRASAGSTSQQSGGAPSSAPWSRWSERFQSNGSLSASSSVSPGPHVHLATWHGSRCVKSFHEYMAY
jgi:hypothetical protein